MRNGTTLELNHPTGPPGSFPHFLLSTSKGNHLRKIPPFDTSLLRSKTVVKVVVKKKYLQIVDLSLIANAQKALMFLLVKGWPMLAYLAGCKLVVAKAKAKANFTTMFLESP